MEMEMDHGNVCIGKAKNLTVEMSAIGYMPGRYQYSLQDALEPTLANMSLTMLLYYRGIAQQWHDHSPE